MATEDAYALYKGVFEYVLSFIRGCCLASRDVRVYAARIIPSFLPVMAACKPLRQLFCCINASLTEHFDAPKTIYIYYFSVHHL
jgi:hypothetical protein